MEEVGSGSSGIAWFVLMLVLEIIFYGFSTAMQKRRLTVRKRNRSGLRICWIDMRRMPRPRSLAL